MYMTANVSGKSNNESNRDKLRGARKRQIIEEEK